MNEEFPTVIDSSMRVDFSSCEKKFYYRHVLGLAPRSVNIHLNAGGAYAKALETFRKLFYSGEADFETARAEGVLALIKSYGNNDFDPGEAKQWYRMIDAFMSYLQKWSPATDYLRPAVFNGGPAVEFSFAIPLDHRHPTTGDPILYTGRFDMFGEMNDMLFVVDDKTTSRLGPTWSQQWELRSQFTGYCWGAAQYGHPVAGAIVRGTAILKHDINHAEAIVYRPQWMLDRWEERLHQDIPAMKQCFETKCYRNNGEENGSCYAYSGCAYQRLCQSNNPEAWMETEYVIHRWNPMQK